MREKVAIFGGGLMGSGIAAVSALAGNVTTIIDIDKRMAEKGVASALVALEALKDFGLANEEASEKAKELLIAGESLEIGLEGATLVIEAIYENVEAKRSLFNKIDSLTPPNVPILSNTSGLRITDIASNVKHPERTMTAHFWFPAHLVPLVEVVMWEKTDSSMAAAVKERLVKWGKAPVIVKRDLPGQLANRILQAVIREAVNIVSIDLASAEDVDTAIKMGMGIRFPAWGPLEHIDAVGLDLCESVQRTVLPEISGAKEPIDYMTELVAGGNLGYKTGRGFYDWSVKSMDELAKGRDEFIVHALKKIKK